MRFSFTDNAYRAIKITGPAHNLLGLEFTEDGETCEQSIVDLRNCDQSNLSQVEIVRHVNRGVSDANRDYGVNYFAKTIQYVGDDTPEEERYSELAYKIVERLAAGESFESK